MGMPKGPWDERWEFVSEEELGKGGQGTTYEVRPKGGGDTAVLKLLRNNKNAQARRRVFQEVGSLRVVAAAGGAVPRVLHSNTEGFENADLKLFFVMELIGGQTLRQFVDARGPLPLDDAAEITLSVARTIEIGHAEEVLHRDLKPENIMVRGDCPLEAVLLDYGVAYNKEDGDGATLAGEALDNDFLSLPERRSPGGNKREKRSDITSLAAILYYCLTGHRPRDLRDEKLKQGDCTINHCPKRTSRR